mmetsp:Transcript_1749/g.2595  ORF Transcript_1749/g.2595 Transcript_1749/m.2595 type:complete len:162 (+) Transcript_1749:35-520(+)
MLYDESGNRVAQDMYKLDHEGVRSFVVPDPEAHHRLATTFGYKGDKSVRNNALSVGLCGQNVKFKFVRERFDEHGILQGVGKSDKRYQHASYRYTIADKNKFFAPYEDLNIHEWVQCDSCDKWRKLPANISPDELPHEWHCTMNTWDTRIATCDASEEEED